MTAMSSIFSILRPMKRILLSILFAVLPLLAVAADDPTVEYIRKYSDLAVSEMKRTGVPASITLAQGILESNSGQSKLAVKGNNHFGIKCHNDWNGRKMRLDDDARRECFRVYRKVEDSYRDHSDFLRYRDRYKSLFDLPKDDYKGWARGLKKAGYATDPAYANKLIALIEKYELYRFDRKTRVERKPPREVEAPREIPVEPVPENVERNYDENVSVNLRLSFYEVNGVRVIYSIQGETYASIASANGLFLKEILKFNDLVEAEPLEPGTVVYLGRKKTQAAKEVTKYVVDHEGETLRDIAQRYGVRLASLEKMNPELAGRALEEGDTVKLRKKE